MQKHHTRKILFTRLLPLLLIFSLFGLSVLSRAAVSPQENFSNLEYSLHVHDGNCPVTGGGWISYRGLGNPVKEQVHVAAIGNHVVEICAEGHAVDSDSWFSADGLDSKGCFLASGIGTQTASVKENWSKHHNPPGCVDLYNASFRIDIMPADTPTPTPTASPTSTPTVTPTNTPTTTSSPTPTVTLTPTSTPSITPTDTPSVTPTSSPTSTPTTSPTSTPTLEPTSTPTVVPTNTPTTVPSTTPVPTATVTPTTGSILTVLSTPLATRVPVVTDTFQVVAFTTTTPTTTVQPTVTTTPTVGVSATPTGRVLAETVVDNDTCNIWPDICSIILFILALILTLFSLLYHREKKQRENK